MDQIDGNTGYNIKQIFGSDKSNDDDLNLRPGPFVAYSSWPLKIQSRSKKHKMIYQWTFECINIGYNDMIGIISSLRDIHNTFRLYRSKCKTYYWWADEGLYSGYKVLSKRGSWKSGDKITITLNAVDWTLFFSKNGKRVYGPLRLKQMSNDCIFYPVIYCHDGPAKYKLI